MSKKYAALGAFLETVTGKEITLSFRQIEEVLGESLPKSASDYDVWWSNSPVTGRHNAVWLDRGWQTADLNRKAMTVGFRRNERMAVSTGKVPVRRINASASPTLLEVAPVAAANDISLKFEWRLLGRVGLDMTGRLGLPTVADVPGLYRLRIERDRQTQFYIGESQSLRVRFGNYRSGSKGQATSHRIHELLKSALTDGASISVDVVIGQVELVINGAPMAVDLASKETRRMIEHAAIVACGGTDIELANR
jgi:hypothetical protein